MIDPGAFEREVRELHAFFEGWYAGDADRSEIARLDALDPGFVMIAPDGRIRSRDAVASAIANSYGRTQMTIEIRNVTVHAAASFCTYEEWQTVGGITTGRVSTAVMAPAVGMPNGLRWIHLHETWLPAVRP